MKEEAQRGEKTMKQDCQRLNKSWLEKADGRGGDDRNQDFIKEQR